MVESGKEYVLQWTGHAAHVTERFSGLLARQALVDVTLICQGQKLRVHKLVLASCSLYFEEMLEQDLGQEPVILLRDLDFEVLKAMVEFMYCGETTISHCHLQTLLDAAQVFKVKELEGIVKSMLGSEKPLVPSSRPEDSEGIISSSSDRSRFGCSKSRPSGERFDDASMSSPEENATSKGDQSVDNVAKSCYEEEDDDDDDDDDEEEDAEHSLYETTSLATETGADSAKEEERESSELSSDATLDSSDSETSKMCTSEDDEEANGDRRVVSPPGGETDFESMYGAVENATRVNEKNSLTLHSRFEHQDAPSGVGECSKVYTHKKRKYPDYSRENLSVSPTESSGGDDDDDDDDEDEDDDARRLVEKSLKVYTHKRRKSVDERKYSSTSGVADSMKEASSTSCIDLADEASGDDPPVTLPATLDMETSEYIWSLSSESIQYVVGCTINQSSGLIGGKEVGNGNLGIATPPVLRRSVRINQLESDDTMNNNGSTKSRERQAAADLRSDDYSGNNGTVGKTKRKVAKETESRVADENNVTTTTTTTASQQNSRKNANNSRSLRSRSKLASRKSSGKKRCSLARGGDKDEQKTKSKGKKIESADCDVPTIPARLNTIASVDRALWGDMSDVLENREGAPSLAVDYSASKEIPFAVGLLPLRAALERMQATLDHQPRKTRSSVALPSRQDLNCLKWKHGGGDGGDVVAAANTVCHIQIRTSSQCTQNRRTSPSEQMVAVGSTSETNRR